MLHQHSRGLHSYQRQNATAYWSVAANTASKRATAPQAQVSTSAATTTVSLGEPPVSVDIRRAITPAELRAASYLRAASFYKYPEDRSPMAQRAHRRMKADTEWDSVTAKVEGSEVAYRSLTVICYIAVTEDTASNPITQRPTDDMDPTTKLPSIGGRPPLVVVGTLDLNQGAVLPAEELIGKLPKEGAKEGRAYLSNVCVAQAARRRGIAEQLMLHAEAEARELGVTQLYVHVVHDNTPAIQLYRSPALGFEVESEESEGFAHGLQRPRRLLLTKSLV